MSPVDSSQKSPWKGLDYYTEEDKDLFFGRDREVAGLFRMIQRDILTVLFGRSGLGKSSLLRAGLIPRLREQNIFPVIVRISHADTAPSPVAQIVAEIIAAAAKADIDTEAEGNTDSSQWQGSLWEFFHCHSFWTSRNDLATPILILDQFEEAFTLGLQNSRTTDFIAQLADLAENRMPKVVLSRLKHEKLNFDPQEQNYKVLLSLREDYVAKLDSLRPLMPCVMRNRYMLASLNVERAMEVVLKAGKDLVTEEVASEIVAAATGKESTGDAETPTEDSEDIEPAYLSVICDELFRRMVAQGKTTIDSALVSEEQGSILDALYERSFKDLSPATRDFVEDKLLTPGGQRISLPREEAENAGVPASDLDRLVENRLLRIETRHGCPQLELSHDLLVKYALRSRTARKEKAKAAEERQKQEQIAASLRRRLWAALACVALSLGISCFCLYGWVIPYEVHCKGFTKRWGTPYPVGVLPKSAIEHRTWTLRLTYRGRFGLVRTAELLDAQGRLTDKAIVSTYLSNSAQISESGRNPARFEYVLDREKRIVSESAFDRTGRMIWGFVYVPDEKINRQRTRQSFRERLYSLFGSENNRMTFAKAMYIGPNGYPLSLGKRRAEFIEFRYDHHGFEVGLRYLDRDDRPTPGADDAYGQSFEFDVEGRVIRKTSLDQSGKPTIDTTGNASMMVVYDKDGNPIEERAFDEKSEATLVKSGYSRQTRKHDQWGQITETRFFNLADEPAEDTEELRAHRITWEYDVHGNLVKTKLYNTQDEAFSPNTKLFDFPAHEQRLSYDWENRVISVAYFNENGMPLTGPSGWQSTRIEYDKNSFISAISYFDQEGRKVNASDTGVHHWVKTNDIFGQAIEERFYDTKGQAISLNGYHLRKNQYDAYGNLIAQSYFDDKGRPALDRTDDTHSFESKFDRFRNATSTRYLGLNGEPINSKQGFHKVESRYNDYGSLISSRWLDRTGHPVPGPDGVPVLHNRYDDRGLLRETSYLDVKRDPAVSRQGFSRIEYVFNEKRQETKRQYFGQEDKPVEDAEGNHLIFNEFDSKGRPTLRTRLRADGSANLDHTLGIATAKMRYGKDNTWIEHAYYDEKGKLISGPFGYARGVVEPQADGRLAQVNYGPDDKPAFNPLLGSAIRKFDKRTQGDTVESYHDTQGRLTTGPGGYAEARSHWGKDGKLLSIAYFGPDGMRVPGPKGFHRAERPEAGGAVRHFSADGQELKSLGLETVVPVIALTEIPNVKVPAARAGIQAGDILWRYGDWSFVAAFAAEKAKATPPDKILIAIAKSFSSERDRLSGEAVSATVIRHGKPFSITMPPLPEKLIGARLTDQAVPAPTFEAWETATAEK